jgi:glyoxylase-like metal-dependent hydrolase (beta-lactamase superfamily II)
MKLTRRDFTRLLGAGAAGAALPDSLFAATPRRQETFFTWRPIGTRIHVAFGQGGNVMLLRDGQDALISDSKNLGYGITLRREAEALGARLRYFVNTHHHADHVGGNAVFTPDIPLIAQRTATARIRTWAEGLVGRENQQLATAAETLRGRGGSAAVIAEVDRVREQLRSLTADRFVPTREIGESDEIRVGTRTVQLRHIGRGHTDNDVFLFLPEENVLHTGDLLFNGSHGFMDQNGGVLSQGWQRSVQAMIALTNSETVVIPGHGEITNRAGLQRQYDYFEQMRDAVTRAVAQGMTKEQVMELRPAAVSDITGNLARNLGVFYDEVRGIDRA